MTALDEDWFARAVGRIWKVMAALAVAGTLATLFWRGWRWGAGFAAGAVISCLNFRWLKNLTDVLGGTRLRRGRALVLAFRYLLLGGGAYVILRYSPVSLAALLTGLFVSIAAAIMEAVFELFRG